MSTPQAAPPSAPTRSATTTPATFRTFAAPPLPPPQEPSPAEALNAALPPPQIFDILPALHELLSRLLAHGVAAPAIATATNGDSGSASTSAAQTQTQTQTEEQPPTQPDATGTATPATLTTGASQSQPSASQPLSQTNGAAAVQTHTSQYTTLQPTYPNQEPLSIQHLAAEVSSIRNMIRRAREAVSGLPDIDRSVEEQQEEIVHLTNEVARLRGVLAGLKVQGEVEAR